MKGNSIDVFSDEEINNLQETIRILEKERYKARQAIRLVLALNRQPIDACVPKVGGLMPYVVGYPIDKFRVDLDPKAEEQLKEALG